MTVTCNKKLKQNQEQIERFKQCFFISKNVGASCAQIEILKNVQKMLKMLSKILSGNGKKLVVGRNAWSMYCVWKSINKAG